MGRLPGRAVVHAAPDVVVDHGEDGPGRAGRDDHTVDVGVGDHAVQLAPGLAAVGAAAHPVNLQADPDVAAIGRVDRDRGRARDADRRAGVGDLHLTLRPALAGVGRAVDARLVGVPVPANMTFGSVGRSRCSRRPSRSSACPASPFRAPIFALIEAHVRSSVDELRTIGIGYKTSDDGIRVQTCADAHPAPSSRHRRRSP